MEEKEKREGEKKKEKREVEKKQERERRRGEKNGGRFTVYVAV